MSQRICLSRCPWERCCAAAMGVCCIPLHRRKVLGGPILGCCGLIKTVVEHGPRLLQFLQELLVFTSHRCKANGNRQHRELCFRVWNHLQIALIFVTKGEFVVSMLWGPLETAYADILQLLVFQHLVVDHSHWSILTGHGYIVGNMATIGIYRAGSTSLDFNALCPNFINVCHRGTKIWIHRNTERHGEDLLPECSQKHSSNHSPKHSFDPYPSSFFMKSICTCWLDAARCESGKNHQDTWSDALSSHIVWTWVKLQHKVSENDSGGRPASLLLWAEMSLNHLKKRGKKNLPSYDRKTRAWRAKKLGMWPKRAPTMWAARTLLWWPPCDLRHWS